MAALALVACAPADAPEVFETTLAAKDAAGVEPGEFAAGEVITLELVSTNLTDRVQQIDWCGGARFDIAVYSSGGNLVWNLYHDLAFTAALQSDEYGPHEQRSGSMAWDQRDNDGQPLPPQAYYAIASACAYQGDYVRIEGFTSDPVDFLIR